MSTSPIDFEFVFANASFTDNLTIYMTIIVCLILYLILTLWSLWQDRKDRQKLRSLPLPDNDVKNRYLYEILTFTGHWDGSSCDSGVYFELTGDQTTSGKFFRFHRFSRLSGSFTLLQARKA